MKAHLSTTAKGGRAEEGTKLFENYLSELTCQVVAGTGSVEQRAAGAIGRFVSTEINRPELVDVDHRAPHVFHGAHERTCLRIECIDGAFIGVIRDQQSVAQRPKIPRRHGESPRLVQRPAMDE